jgi:prepilin-type N-terminal cleavage/methylation domain-containing protein
VRQGCTRPDRAFTLLELIAAIAIVLILVGVVVMNVRSIRDADLNASSGRLSAMVRYLFDMSVLKNRTYRLVVDLGENAYWGEAVATGGGGCGAGLLPGEDERKFGIQAPGGAAGTGMGTGTGTGVAGPGNEASPVGGGAAAADDLLTPEKLPKGISFAGVMTSHQDELTEEGKAEVYFFPGGYVEHAYIFLKYEDKQYTVETLPLRGAGKVHTEAKDPRDLLDRS